MECQAVAGSPLLILYDASYLLSNGFYPCSLKLDHYLHIQDQMFHLILVQFDQDELIQKKSGPIQFSQDVAIVHSKSRKIIAATMQDDKLVLTLNDNLDRRCLFRIQPCYKSQVQVYWPGYQNSNIVNYEDDIYIQFSPENDAYADGLVLASVDLYLIQQKQKSPFTSDIHLSNQKSTIFRFQNVQLDESKSIKYGDYIQIKSIETDAYLQITNDSPEHVFDLQTQCEGLFKQDWRVLWSQKQQNNIWRIYHPYRNLCSLNDTFYLCNFQTNLYYFNGQLTSDLDKATLVYIEEIQQNNSILYLLKDSDTNQIISFNGNMQTQLKETHTKLDFLQINVVPHLEQHTQSWLDSVVQLLQKTTEFFKKGSVIPFIKNDTTEFQLEEYYFLLNYVECCFKDLVYFCSPDFEKNRNITRDSVKYIKTSSMHQDLLREKRILQLSIQLIDSIQWDLDCTQLAQELMKKANHRNLSRNESQNDTHSVLIVLKDTLNLIFLFIEVFAAHHDINSAIVLGSYFRLRRYFGLGIGAFYCFIRLFETNQELIPLAGTLNLMPNLQAGPEFNMIKRQTRITTQVNFQGENKTLIDDMFRLAKSSLKDFGIQYWSNILRLLCVWCLQNGKACFNNQMIIGKQILLQNVMIPIKVKEEYKIYVPIHDDVEINDLYQQSWRAGEQIIRQIQVFQAFLDNQLNLIGLCCKERNYENIQKFRPILPQQHLIKYVSNYRNHEVLRCRLITILMNLYVDCYPYTAKPNPKLIMNTFSIKNQRQTTSNRSISQSVEMKDFISPQKPQKYTDDEMYAVKKLMDINQEILRTMLITQGTVNLIPSVWKVLTMYFKLYTFNFPGQNIELLLEALIKLPSSLSQKEPSQDTHQEYQEFQEQKETFNQIAITLCEFFIYHFYVIEYQSLKQFIALQILQFEDFNFRGLFNSLMELICHYQTLPESKLKALELLLIFSHPRRNIIRRMKHYLFLEDQNDLRVYQLFKQSKTMLLELESAKDKAYKQSIDKLNEIYLIFQQDPIIFKQILFRLMNFDVLLLEFLDSYSQVCYLVTQKHQRSCIDDRYVMDLSSEERHIITFCEIALKILNCFVHMNQKNKKRILKKFYQIDDLMRCLDLGQFELFCKIYSNSKDLAEQASPKMISILLENSCVHSNKVLKSLISQQGVQIESNIIQVTNLLQNGSHLKKLFGLTAEDLIKQLEEVQAPFQVLKLVGLIPYIQQIEAIGVVSKLFENQKSIGTLCKVFQDYFPGTNILKLIVTLEDLFESSRFKDMNLDKLILKTTLRQHLLQLLNKLIQNKGSILGDESFQQFFMKFLEVEIQKMSWQNQQVSYEDFLKVRNQSAEKKYNLLRSLYQNDRKEYQGKQAQLSSPPSSPDEKKSNGELEDGESQKSSSSHNSEEEDIDQEKEFHLIALLSLETDFTQLHYNNYALKLLGFILNLIQVVLEQIAIVEDTNQKNKARSTSMVARQVSLTQSLLESSNFEMLNNAKVKKLHEMKTNLSKFLLILEEYLKIHLSRFEIQENIEFIQDQQTIFHMLIQRKLEFTNFSQQLIINKGRIIDPYQNPTYIYDKRIYDLAKLQKQQNNTNILSFQIETLVQSNQQLLEERYIFIKQLFQSEFLKDEQFIKALISSLQYAIQNINRFHKLIFQTLEIFQHLIDLHGIVAEDLKSSMSLYKSVVNGVYQSKSQEIILHKSLQMFQTQIVNSGFYQIFVQFCANYERIQIAKFTEYNQYNLRKKRFLFDSFIVTSIKLVKGYESANRVAQSKLIEEIQTQKNNDMLKYFQQNFLIQSNIQLELERILLAYEFNQNHIYLTEDRLRLCQPLLQVKLMQLLAEDHFRPFQDYFREQPTFLRSYDILDSLVLTLQTQFSQETFQQLSFDEYEFVVSVFDCLKEFIQGPCPFNQAKICQTPFLRLCLKLLSYDDSQAKFLEQYQPQDDQRARQMTINQCLRLTAIQEKTNLQQNVIAFYSQNHAYSHLIVQSFRRSNPQNFRLYMLSQIKFRCATTLESLTDSDKVDNENIVRIASVISEQLLIKNLTIQYEKFKILYGSGKNYNNFVFSHLNGKPPDFKVKQQQEKLPKHKLINEENFLLQESLGASLQVHEDVTGATSLQDFWLSFIIETGFSLFVILAEIYQLKQLDVLDRIYEQISNNKTKKKKLQGIFIYQLFKFLFQASGISRNLVESDSEKLNKKVFSRYKIKKALEEKEAQEKKLGYRALRFFATRTGSLEILLPNKILKKVIFPLMPHCFVLEDTIKNKFTDSIDRLSQQTKVESILFLSSNVIHKLKTEYSFQNLYKQSIIINLLASNLALWKQIIFLVIVTENLLILLSSNGQQMAIMDEIVFILNCIQISMQFLCFFIFIVKKLPYLKAKAQEEIYQRQVDRIKTREIKYRYLDNSHSLVTQETFMIDQSDILLKETNKYKQLYFWISDSLVLYKYIFFDYEMIYFLIFTTFAIIGLFFRIALAALLLDVFWRFPTLTSIVNSIWRPRTQIILVLALFIIMQYYYSLIVYNYYAEDYYPVCQNLLQCFSFIFDVTFKTDGGVVGYFLSSEQNQEAIKDPNFRFGLKNLLEFIYVFVVISLLYSIITGIIIDTFGVLRDEADELENDIQGFCLICGIDRGTIEKKAKHKKGFKFHVKHEHSVWNYIFYISYLEDKKKSEYNGIESIVEAQLKVQSISWFPIGKAISIPEEADQKEEYASLRTMLNDRLLGIENQLRKK